MTDISYINKNVTVIIRTVGERTTELCYELVKKQIAAENIHIISETPFTEAVRKTFEVGLRENRMWTFVVDADVLIKPSVIEKIVCHAETFEQNVFEVEGKIIDKFIFNINPREAGNHLYRTSLFEEAMQYVPDPYKEIRPETFIKELMKVNGYPWIKSHTVVGIHDFEQYYKDIYRKCFVQAKKHGYIVNDLVNQWEVLSFRDKDYEFALQGFRAGIGYNGPMLIDKTLPFEIEEQASFIQNIKEKVGINKKIEEILYDVVLDSLAKEKICCDLMKELKEEILIKDENTDWVYDSMAKKVKRLLGSLRLVKD